MKPTDALGHNHEWDELWHKDKNRNHVRKEGWVFCWICDSQERWEDLRKEYLKKNKTIKK